MTKRQAIRKAQQLANQEGRTFHVLGDQRRAFVYPEGTLELVGPGVVVVRPVEAIAPTYTYRERRERRASRLRGWADSRDIKSAASFAQVDRIADGIPMGQPILLGHHSEGRARRDQDRIHSGMRAGIDHATKAASMRSRADNIDAAAERAIYSDDADAAEKLAERIADLEAERGRITAYNAACRKAGRCTAEALALLDDRQRADLTSITRYASYQLRDCGAFPTYATSNLSGNISKQRERLANLAAR